MYWIRQAQKPLNVIPAKQFEKFSPFIDEENVMVISGRLRNSEIFEADTIHPKLLPQKHRVSELIVQDIHEFIVELWPSAGKNIG